MGALRPGAATSIGDTGNVVDPVSESDERWRALTELYRAEQLGMLRLASLLLQDPDLAEEVVQDAFVRLHPKVLEVDRPGAYLRTAVVNACLGQRRHQAVQDRHRPDGPSSSPAPDLPADLSPVWLALERLPERQRDAIVLRFYLDLPDREIAELLGARPGTVASLIHRGLKALEEVLAP
jgi:RNA polymerase sigma factor (sigma-70 family)